MRLGTETGSLINHVLTSSKSASPEVGMGATLCSWSDRSPATVTKVWTDKRGAQWAELQADSYRRIDKNGFSECQEYEYSPNPDAPIITIKLHTDGKWRPMWKNPDTGRYSVDKSQGIVLGRRERYFDFSF
jgi:hypothetical protein